MMGADLELGESERPHLSVTQVDRRTAVPCGMPFLCARELVSPAISKNPDENLR